MALENRIIQILKENKEFILAGTAYVSSLAIDYFSTAFGLTTNQIQEISPLYKDCISHFGIYYGLLIPKLLGGSGIIFASKYIDGKYILKNKVKVKSNYILYSGASLTAGVGLSWWLEKWLF